MTAGTAETERRRDGGPAGRPLSRILGLGFGLAVMFGGTVGVGILRLPGTIAAQLGSFWPIVLVWVAGGAYALLGAVSVSELSTAMPQAGGFYVYAKRAFGGRAGFAVGWADWLNNCAVIAFGAVAAGEYVGSLAPGLRAHTTMVALSVLAAFFALNWAGLRLGSSIQQATSAVTAMTFLVLAGACLAHPAGGAAGPDLAIGRAGGYPHLLAPVVAALRAIVVTYDGWYEAIYFSEEAKDATRHLPRAMIGGVALVLSLYVLMNLAFLHVLPMATLAASTLPAADAASVVFPAWSGQFVTVLSLLTLLGLVNAVLLSAPRILLAIGRDGLLTERAAAVGPGGTPRPALALSAAMAALLIASGKFEDIIAVAAILVAAMYSLNYSAIFVLRVREPRLERPFRAWGYPVTTGCVLAGSLLFLAAAIHDDARSAWRAGALAAAAVPAYSLLVWRRRRQGQAVAP